MSRPRTSVIIPSRNERFLPETIDDLCAKATGDIEVIAILEGYWPERVSEDKRVHYLHWGKPRGMRAGLNAAVSIAKGEFVMKLDGHCMVSEGFDTVLADVCQPNWVCVPTRHRLDPENWCINDGNRPPINYLRLDPSNQGMNVVEWRVKNRNRDLDAERISDILSMQGSCFFLPKAYWYELELLDEANYGSFRKDPQEVSFKAWLSGGRTVRVKDAWYAHLHKGKKYGRGYSPSRRDWRKGDEYVKKWYTDEAWDKATKPWAWLMHKFSDMPGFEHYADWQEPESEKNSQIVGDIMPKQQDKPRRPGRLRAYQYLEVDGVPLTKTPTERRGSKFWNEGKWEHFIAPLLPDDCSEQTFVEMGCNAGLFLSLAADRGFARIIGVEKNKTPHRAALRYRDARGYDYEVLKRALGGKFGNPGNFDIDELPMADITLLSNFHYHIDINSWYRYLDRLISKTCYVLVVSTPDVKQYRWRVNAQLGYMAKYFHQWEAVAEVPLDSVSQDGDPKPRRLFSVLYKSPSLSRMPIDAIVSNDGFGGIPIQQLTEQVMAGGQIDITETTFYDAWRKRKPRWKERTLLTFTQGKLDLVTSLIADGPKDPILVQKGTRRICDGGHRRLILKTMGHKSVIVREVC